MRREDPIYGKVKRAVQLLIRANRRTRLYGAGKIARLVVDAFDMPVRAFSDGAVAQ